MKTNPEHYHNIRVNGVSGQDLFAIARQITNGPWAREGLELPDAQCPGGSASAADTKFVTLGLAASMPHRRSRTCSIILIGVITLPYEDAFHVVLPPGEVGVGRCGLAGPPHSVRPGAVYAGVA